MNKQREDIFILKSKGELPVKVDLDAVEVKIVLSQEFWEYFTSTFPAATAFLFNQQKQSSSFLELTDTSYVGIVISFSNRLPIINHLPKDLSQEQSDSYFKASGHIVIPIDSLNDSNGESGEESEWKEASPKVQREFQLFRSMLDNFDSELVVVAKRRVVEKILKDN